MHCQNDNQLSMLHKILFALGFIILGIPVFGQQKAITDTGAEVVLYNDGTWAYVQKDTLNVEEILTNDTPFKKSKSSSFLIKSKRINVGCWMDPKKWKFNSAPDNDAAEFELTHESGNLYGIIITENLDLPLESLGNIAIQNGREAAPDLQVTAKEYRNVNGVKVLMMRMVGTIQDITFSYFGYYYSANGGAVQFLVYSSESFMEENLGEVEGLLNGLVQLEK